MEIILLDMPTSKEHRYICKWCLNKKSKEEVGLLSEQHVESLYTPIIKYEAVAQKSRFLRSCNDCIFTVYRMDSFNTRCELAQFRLRQMIAINMLEEARRARR